MTVEVVLPLPLDQAYTYCVPAALRDEAQAGSRVLVPFGPRRLTGLIVAEGEADPDELDFEVKPLLDVLDDRPAFTGHLLRLTRWMADYYVCSWGEVVKAALPTGTGIKSRHRLVRTSAPVGGWEGNAAAQAVLRDLEARGPTTLSALRKRAEVTVPLADVRRLERAGLVRLDTGLSDPKIKPRREKHLRFAPAFRHDGAASALKAQLRGHKQKAVIEALAGFRAEGEATPRQADVKARAEASASTVRSLVEKGMVEVLEREVMRSPFDALPAPPAEPPRHVLHPAQQAALGEVETAIEGGSYATFLLHGVTGSGKTEVYIAALKRVLARGKTGIILVPEIALTPQTVQRFRAHFGDRIAVLHSQMSLGERYDMWRGLREGRFSVAIGPRSAVLAPLENLGLLVVDEEHEASYKQFDPAPRYHARDVAVMRAHMAGAVCILGSATPSLESTMNARRGKYRLLNMPERVPVPGHAAAPLPEVRIVDLTYERKKGALDGALSMPLREAIEARLAREEQAILLQNRRGYAPVIECEACGWSPTCGDCAVTLTYHKARRHLRCHYCGRARALPQACPKCDAHDLTQIGTGTQRVEEELAACFPEARILRMDRDTTGRKNAHRRILRRFSSGAADVLLGTQMIAKGLDFGRVTLVGVVDADVGLLLPDFRAEERTFQLLTQVAGRAGRAGLRGEVFLQTRNSKHTVLQRARHHDYDGFARAALRDRQALGYPPFGHLAVVEFRGPEEEKVEQLAEAWTALLRRRADGVEVQGPHAPLVGRVKRQYRLHTLLKAPLEGPRRVLQAALHYASEEHGTPPRGYHVAINVDAVGMF